jgi:hypothetical protein
MSKSHLLNNLIGKGYLVFGFAFYMSCPCKSAVNVDSEIAYALDSRKGLVVEEKGLTYSLSKSKSTVDRFGFVHFNSPFLVPGLEKVEMVLTIAGG